MYAGRKEVENRRRDRVNTDRNKIIEKLKTIKDPAERDRLMWALSGLEKDTKTAPSQPAASEQTGSTPEQAQNIPQLPMGVRNLFAYFVPGFFMVFGILNLLGALAYAIADERSERVIPKLIMGAMFLVFGIIGLRKAKKRIILSDQETKTDQP